ncbi:MAG: urea carboxylase-associated family protein [Acidiferrobacterales bacterium]|nr:urea carboxylase-associated family protein [Acidiferrobacterales bacterium]
MLELRSTSSQERELEVRVPVGDAVTFALAPGQFLNIASNGEPVVGSLFAFVSEDRSEWLSVGNTRILLGTLCPYPGQRLFSNRRRALLVWVQDSSSGHDLLLPPCAQPAGTTHSPIPALAKLDEGFARIGADRAHMPDPLNLFLDTRIDADGRIAIHPSSAGPGEHVVLRATTGLFCVILAWSLAEASLDAGAALAVSITNERPTHELAGGR